MSVTKSIGSNSRDYATLALWAAFVNVQDLASTGSQIGECYNDSEFGITVAVTFGGWTNADATHTVTLTCHAGQSFRDNASVQTNTLRYVVANGVGVKTSTAYISHMLKFTGAFAICDGLQVNSNGSNAGGCVLVSGANGVVQNCILYGRNGEGTNRGLLRTDVNSTLFRNCAIIVTTDNIGRGVRHTASGAGGATDTDLTVLCTCSSTNAGISLLYSGPVVVNCAVAGFTTDYEGTAGVSSTNNATDLGAFGGTNFGGSGQVSLVGTTEWQSVTAGSEDVRLKSTSVKLKDNGATTGPANDIAGTSRPQGSAYDIGCWELKSSVKTPWPLWQARAA